MAIVPIHLLLVLISQDFLHALGIKVDYSADLVPYFKDLIGQVSQLQVHCTVHSLEIYCARSLCDWSHDIDLLVDQGNGLFCLNSDHFSFLKVLLNDLLDTFLRELKAAALNRLLLLLLHTQDL